jgi:hypothetical protein
VLVGTTTVENLLRVARSDAAAGTAFAALLAEGRPPQIVAVPPPGTSEGLSSDELGELVQLASSDPEFLHARVFVRSVLMGHALTLAVAPLRDGIGRSMIGVVAESGRTFEPPQLGVLEQLAQRLLRHLQVVQQLNSTAGDARDQDRDDAGRADGAEGSGDSGDDAANGDSPRRVRPEPPKEWEPLSRVVPSPPRLAYAESVEEPGPARATASPPREPAPGGSPAWQPSRTPSPASESTGPAPALWWAQSDPLTGLPGLGQFFSRAGRMLAQNGGTIGSLALVVIEVSDARTTPEAARALVAQLRFSDPAARIDDDLLAAAVLLFPAGAGDVVELRLASAVRVALNGQTAVHAVHVVAEPGDPRDVDELLRDAVSRLPGRQAGGGGAPWRGAGGSAARLPIP